MVTLNAARISEAGSHATEVRIPQGYKQTEVGLIPEDWQTPTLGSVTSLMTNGFVGTATTHYTSEGMGVLYIQGYNVEENAFNFHGIKFVTLDFHHAHLKSCLRANDLLTVQTGDIGLTTIVPESLAGSNCHALIISRFDPKRVCPAFVSRYLNSKPGRARLALIQTGTTMKHLNVSDMVRFVIPLPGTKHEQEAIARALTDADALIESLEQLTAKKRQIKQGAMQKLLTGKKRLPGFTEDWDWDTPFLGDLFSFKNGLNKAKQFFGYGTPIVNYMDVYQTRGIHGTDLQGRVCVSKDELKAFEVRKGDVFFTRTSETAQEVGITTVILDHVRDTVFSGFVLRARPRDDSLDDRFKQYCFSTAAVRQQIISQSTETTRALTNGRYLSRVSIRRPRKREQIAIAELLDDIAAEIAALETKLARTRQIKQGMMQELLTGRIRLV
jgi:type I restriction enzyme S subunit